MDLPFHGDSRRNRPERGAFEAELLAEGDFERRAIASRRRWRTMPASSAAPNSRKGMLQIASAKIHSLFKDISNPEIFVGHRLIMRAPEASSGQVSRTRNSGRR